MKLRVISPWYPSEYSPHSGKFVESQVMALQDSNIDVSVEVPRVFPTSTNLSKAKAHYYLKKIANSGTKNLYTETCGATWVPCPVFTPSNVLSRAKGFESGFSLRYELIQDDADIVHAHLGLPTGWAVSGLVTEPLVITEHQSNLRYLLSDPRALDAYLEISNRAEVFVCVSEFLKSEILDLLGSGLSRSVTVVPNIVDFDSFDLVNRQEYGCLSWIYVGNLSRNKGILRLLKTFDLYKKKVAPEATLTIIGEGPLFRWIENFALRRGIRNSVLLLGSKPHGSLRDYFSSADLMVHLSDLETFGVAPLEALASGMPVVSFHNGGSDGTWRDIENFSGRLLEKSSSEEDIVEAIVDISEGASRLDFTKARLHLEGKFSAKIVSDALKDIYRDLVR